MGLEFKLPAIGLFKKELLIDKKDPNNENSN